MDTAWPFATGKAPFKVKGIAYAFHMEYVKSEIPGGLAAQNAHFENAALARFFEQPFFATSWYDVYPLMQAGHACGAATHESFEEFVRRRGRHQVKKDLGLVRRALVRMLSPATLATRVPQINATYFDFVKVETRVESKHSVEGFCRGLPGAVLRWYQLVTETFLDEVMARSGADKRVIEWRPPRRAGEAHGIVIYDVGYHVYWD